MSFRQKIDKILSGNNLGIHSISAMEDYCGIGRNTLKIKYDENKAPTLKTLVKIYEKMRVSRQWWDNGEGEIFVDKAKEVAIVEESREEYGTAMWMEKVINLQEKMLKDYEVEVKRLSKELEECRREKTRLG